MADDNEAKKAFEKLNNEYFVKLEELKKKYKNNKHGRIPDDEIYRLDDWFNNELKKIP